MRHYDCYYNYPLGRHGFEDFRHNPWGRGPFAHHSPDRQFGHHTPHFGPRDFGACRPHGPRPEFGSCERPPPPYGAHGDCCRPNGPERECGSCDRRQGPSHCGPRSGIDKRHHNLEGDFGQCGRRPRGFDGQISGFFEHHERPGPRCHSPEKDFGSCGRRPPSPGAFGEHHRPRRGPFAHHGPPHGEEYDSSDFGPCHRKRGPNHVHFGRRGPYDRPGCGDCNSGPHNSGHRDQNHETDSGNEGRGKGRSSRNKPCSSKNKDGNGGEAVLVQRIVVETLPRCNSV